MKLKSRPERKENIMTIPQVKRLKRCMLSINQPSTLAVSHILGCLHHHVTKRIQIKANLVSKKKNKVPMI